MNESEKSAAESGRNDQREQSVGAMHERREAMADARRYIIYFTFEKNNIKQEAASEVKENV